MPDVDMRYVSDDNEFTFIPCSKCAFHPYGVSCDKYGPPGIPRSILNGEKCEYYKKRT